jgi:CRISPR-associated protein Csm1
MPSAYYKSRPDISLYDHARMTGALAAILESSQLTKDELEAILASPKDSDRAAALLVGGDLSGVQDFIYTISARGATSALRGRSFYLQILTDVVVQYILEQLDLPATNLIYAGGGNFYLLARPDDGPRLAEIQKNISRVLFYHHRGNLYLVTAGLPLQVHEFFSGKISKAWGRLTDQLQLAKLQRFSESGEDLKYIFQPMGHGGNEEKQCLVCGEEHPGTKVDPKSRPEQDADGVRKCPPCSSYEDLGEKLRRAENYILAEISPSPVPALDAEPVPGGWEAVLACFGRQLTLIDPNESLPMPNGNRRWVFSLSEAAREKADKTTNARTVSGRRLFVNVTPLISSEEIRSLREKGVQDLPVAGSTKPFHVMEAQATGIPRLGVLRMDVDNLGKLFSEGLGEQASLSRVASLSFAVSLYFEGWVGLLAAKQNESDRQAGKRERLYSIYSGGDDLFFVGSWDVVAELARQIRADLTPYAAGHPGIHASAGIALVDGKYPLYQAAEDAHNALEQAKRHQWAAETGALHYKDSITFLGRTLQWSKFGLAGCEEQNIHSAHALMHLMIDLKDKSAITPLIRRLSGLDARYQEAQEKRREEGTDQNRLGQPQALWGPWNWLGYYQLSRLVRQRHDPSIEDLRDQLKADDFRSMEWIGLAARWAELTLR